MTHARKRTGVMASPQRASLKTPRNTQGGEGAGGAGPFPFRAGGKAGVMTIDNLRDALNLLQDHCCEESWSEVAELKNNHLCGGVFLCAFRRAGSPENEALDFIRNVLRSGGYDA